MSSTVQLVAAMAKSRKAFERIYPEVSEDRVTPYSWYLIDLIKNFYARDGDAKSVDKDFILKKIELDFPSVKKQEIYKEHALECFGADVSAINVAELVLEAKRKESAQALAQSLVGDRSSHEEILDKIAKHSALLRVTSDGEDIEDREVFNNISIDEINSTVLNPEGRIKILSKRTTEELDGGAMGGNVIWIYGRPEIGKSALAITMATVLAAQGLPGIFFDNEDPIKSTISRAQACATRLAAVDRLRDPDDAQSRLDASGYKNIRFVNLAPGSVPEIQSYCEKYKPKWIVVNQIRNLRSRAETRTNMYENIATDLRAVAKQNDILLIGVTQAGDSATNKLVLDIGDVDGSNTGIPAQADVMIGIGSNPEFQASRCVMISLPKNKLSGKHVHFQMKMIPELSRVEDL